MNGIGAGHGADSLIVLIPSLLLGPYSWSLVLDELVERGWETLVSVEFPIRSQRRDAAAALKGATT